MTKLGTTWATTPSQKARDRAAFSERNLALGIVVLDGRMLLHAPVVLDEPRRDAVGQVDRNVIELSGSEMADPDEDLEVRDGEPAVGEVLAAMRDEAALQAVEGVGKRACGQAFALRLLFGLRQAHGAPHPGSDLLDGVHCFVAENRLPGITRIEPGKLADVAVDAIGLRHRLAIQLEHRKSAKWRAGLAALPVGELHPIVLERHAADDHGQPRGLTSGAVDIEVDEF